MDFASAVGMALGASWTSGVNLYAAVATMGLMHRFYGTELPGGLDVCAHPAVIAIAVVMYVAEFVADKIPYVDSCWDIVHTFIRIPAGAVLAMTAFADFDPVVKTLALLLGGGIALGSHGTKAATRALANASPEPFSNILLSTGEDVVAFGVISLAILHPILAGILVVGLIAATIYFLPKIIRLVIRGLLAFKRMLLGEQPLPDNTLAQARVRDV